MDRSPTSRPASGRRGRDLALVVGSIALGMVLVVLVRSPDDPGTVPAPTPTDAPTSGTLDRGTAVPASLPDVAVGDGLDGATLAADEATEPVPTLRGFLAAEARRDFATSWTYLSAVDLERHRTPELWAAAHREFLPVGGFAVLDDSLADSRLGAGSVTVDAVIASPSTLDPVVGLVPARSLARWALVEEAGVWRVSFVDTEFTVLLPPEADATVAAEQWVTAARACAPPPQARTRLLGDPALAQRLCGLEGEVSVGAPTRVAAAGDRFRVLATYGPEALGWSRLVPVDAPIPLDLVVAPVDDRWQVVAGLERG